MLYDSGLDGGVGIAKSQLGVSVELIAISEGAYFIPGGRDQSGEVEPAARDTPAASGPAADGDAGPIPPAAEGRREDADPQQPQPNGKVVTLALE